MISKKPLKPFADSGPINATQNPVSVEESDLGLTDVTSRSLDHAGAIIAHSSTDDEKHYMIGSQYLNLPLTRSPRRAGPKSGLFLSMTSHPASSNIPI